MTDVLADIAERFRFYRALAEAALAQADDAAFFATLPSARDEQAGDATSLALLVKHLAGNYRSRWTDYLTTDGDKPDRNRDTEFEIYETDTREALTAQWDAGWQRLEEVIAELSEEGLSRTVTVRGEPHTVHQSLLRALGHTAYHVGQIVLLAKHHAGDRWRTLSIPRGQSEQYAAEHRSRYA